MWVVMPKGLNLLIGERKPNPVRLIDIHQIPLPLFTTAKARLGIINKGRNLFKQ